MEMIRTASPYSRSGCGARGEAANGGNLQAHGDDCPFYKAGKAATFGHVWPRPEADAKADAKTDAKTEAEAEPDIETCSFDFRACVVP